MRVIRDGSRGTFDLEEFLRRPLFAHLATASEHGPRESPVWFSWEGGALWIIGDSGDTFPGRVWADPRCAIGIVDFDPRTRLVQHAGFRGRATVGPFDVDRAKRLFSRYLGGEDEQGRVGRRVPGSPGRLRLGVRALRAGDRGGTRPILPGDSATVRLTLPGGRCTKLWRTSSWNARAWWPGRSSKPVCGRGAAVAVRFPRIPQGSF